MKNENKEYTPDEHQHRYAAWAASRAAMRGKVRFTVAEGTKLLESTRGLISISCVNDLPAANLFDSIHKKWRDEIISASTIAFEQKKGGEKNKNTSMKPGQAAKLINIYLKTRLLTETDSSDSRWHAVHPPIDAILLSKLAENNIGGFAKEWRKYQKKGWSNFDHSEYEQAIDLVKKALRNRPLWMIEKDWHMNES